jgi:hypothetical protein
MVIESVFIIFKHTGRLNFKCLTSTCVSYLDRGLFVACFVCLILSKKQWISQLTFKS